MDGTVPDCMPEWVWYVYLSNYPSTFRMYFGEDILIKDLERSFVRLDPENEPDIYTSKYHRHLYYISKKIPFYFTQPTKSADKN